MVRWGRWETACARGLWRLPNVVGFGRGNRLVGGRETGEPCITVLVTRKLPLSVLSRSERIPPRLDGRLTDVIAVGFPRLLGVNRRSRVRPVRPGVSIGHYRITAGTLGAVVYATNNGEPLILSNNHVLADVAEVSGRGGSVGDPILQPGPYDGGGLEDTVARLLRFVPMRLTSPGRTTRRWSVDPRSPRNLADAAVARPLTPGMIDPTVLGLGRITGVRRARPGLEVRMSGRTSGLAYGSIRAVEVTVSVGVGQRGTGLFVRQLLTTPLARPGDSGSVLLDLQNRAVGLIFAGSAAASVASPIGLVGRLLDIAVLPPLA